MSDQSIRFSPTSELNKRPLDASDFIVEILVQPAADVNGGGGIQQYHSQRAGLPSAPGTSKAEDVIVANGLFYTKADIVAPPDVWEVGSDSSPFVLPTFHNHVVSVRWYYSPSDPSVGPLTYNSAKNAALFKPSHNPVSASTFDGPYLIQESDLTVGDATAKGVLIFTRTFTGDDYVFTPSPVTLRQHAVRYVNSRDKSHGNVQDNHRRFIAFIAENATGPDGARMTVSELVHNRIDFMELLVRRGMDASDSEEQRSGFTKFTSLPTSFHALSLSLGCSTQVLDQWRHTIMVHEQDKTVGPFICRKHAMMQLGISTA